MKTIVALDKKYSKLDKKIYNSVVGIAIYQKNLKIFSTIGSGLLFKFKNDFYLVTNKHVVDNLNSFYVAFHDADFIDESRQIFVNLKDYSTFKRFYHKTSEVDICIFKISKYVFHNKSLDLIQIENYALTVQEMESLNFYETREVVVLGHPISVSSGYGLHPIVRTGSISQVSYMYSRNFKHKHFLIDAFAYPGNSGGPVIGIVEKIVDDKLVYENCIIGIVQSVVMYNNINTGLSSVIAFEHVLEAIQQLNN